MSENTLESESGRNIQLSGSENIEKNVNKNIEHKVKLTCDPTKSTLKADFLNKLKLFYSSQFSLTSPQSLGTLRMASGSSASIENLCKICLNESHLDGNLSELEIDGTSVMSIIERIIYSIDWTNSVIFPDKICSDCLEIVQTIHKLNERAVESDTRLKRLLATDENGQIIVEEIVTVIETNDDGQDRKQQSDIVDAQQLATSTSIEHDEEADEGKNKCQHCDEIFDEPSRLLQHLKIHDSKRMACEAAEGCTTRFAKQATLMRHEIIHNSGALVKTNEEKHECVVCSEQFMDQRALAAHTTESHKDEIEFQCSFCTEKFSKLSELAKHAKSHSENKSYKCLICAKTFSQGSHLIDHLNRHNNLRPHVCKICNKGKFHQSLAMQKIFTEIDFDFLYPLSLSLLAQLFSNHQLSKTT